MLISLQLDEKEFVVRTVMKINAEMSGAYVFSSGKTWEHSKPLVFRKTLVFFINWTNMKDILGPLTDDIRRIRPAGGAAHIHLHCLTIRLYTMEKYLLTMGIAGLSKCLATNVHSRPIPKSLPISWIICSVYRGLPLMKLQASLLPHSEYHCSKTDLEDQKKHTYLRTMFPSLLVTGPFSIVLGFNGGLMALNDRLNCVLWLSVKKTIKYSSPAKRRLYGPWNRCRKIWSPAGVNQSL